MSAKKHTIVLECFLLHQLPNSVWSGSWQKTPGEDLGAEMGRWPGSGLRKLPWQLPRNVSIVRVMLCPSIIQLICFHLHLDSFVPSDSMIDHVLELLSLARTLPLLHMDSRFALLKAVPHVWWEELDFISP